MSMRKFVSILIFGVFLFAEVSCIEENPNKLCYIKVQLLYPEDSGFGPVAGVEVKAVNVHNLRSYSGTTDENGNAIVRAITGRYAFYITESRTLHGSAYFFDGFKAQVDIPNNYDKKPFVVTIDMSASAGTKQVIIKEVFLGSNYYITSSGLSQPDKYLLLYNNSTIDADLTNLCIAMTIPYDSHTPNADVVDGKLSYENAGHVPAGHGFWTWQEGHAPILKPGEEIAVVISEAINHTLVCPHAVDLSKGKYHVMYDPESGYNDPSYYPTPSEAIPSSHYLKAYKYGKGNVWPISETSPALFIFMTPEGVTPRSFFEDTSNENFYNNISSEKRKWVPAEWVLDACEIFTAGYVGKNNKRLITSVDGGSVVLYSNLGFSIYRNVDREATQAIPENYGELFISAYYDGTASFAEGSTDPTGIDAEHYIWRGARIIYMNTDNSGKDFHQRQGPSLLMCK